MGRLKGVREEGGCLMLRVDDGVGLEVRGSHQECWGGGLVRGMPRGRLEKIF